MIASLLVCAVYAFVVWLIFFKFRWIKFSINWAVVCGFVGVHLLLAFLIGLRYMAPYTTNARIIQHTIQLTPRLSEPTLVTAVLVEPNVLVKRGQPLFQFDKRVYEYRVRQLEAQLAQATQNVKVLKADVDVASQKVAMTGSELEYAKYQQQLTSGLAGKGAGSQEDAQKWAIQAQTTALSQKEAEAEATRARARYQSQIGGVNTTVAEVQAQLDQARYYLENTTMYAPEDGYIINLQVRPGMVAGDYRIGAIASFICDSGRYMLAEYFQENLKYVKVGQPVEVALDLYPGQIWTGRVQAVWQGSGQGQLLPSGTLPQFNAPPPEAMQGQFAVAITLDDPDQRKFPIGTQGAVAIYNERKYFAYLRKIMIRTYTWLSWVYPLNA